MMMMAKIFTGMILVSCVAAQGFSGDLYDTGVEKEEGLSCHSCNTYVSSSCAYFSDNYGDHVWCSKGCMVQASTEYAGQIYVVRGCFEDYMKEDRTVTVCYKPNCNTWDAREMVSAGHETAATLAAVLASAVFARLLLS